MEKEIKKIFLLNIAFVPSTGVFIYGVHDFEPITFNLKDLAYLWILENGNGRKFTITEIYTAE